MCGGRCDPVEGLWGNVEGTELDPTGDGLLVVFDRAPGRMIVASSPSRVCSWLRKSMRVSVL
jgi:hypothetical protein